MSTNYHAPNDNQALGQFINAAAAAGSVGSLFYPDMSVALYVKACVAGGTSAGRPGAPSLEVAQAMYAALGA